MQHGLAFARVEALAVIDKVLNRTDRRRSLRIRQFGKRNCLSVVAKFVRAPLAHDLNCPDHTSSVCAYNEHVGFPVYRELLDSIVSTYDPSKSDEWKFRFIPRIGDDYHDGLLVAEIVGFLEAVDSYKETYL